MINRRARSFATRFIASRRRSRPISWAHRLAQSFEDAYENIGAEFSRNGEADLLKRLAALDFTTVVDVGANFGDWSVAALHNWPSAFLHAFEVAPKTFRELETRLSRETTMGRARLNNCGLGERASVQTMYYFPDHPELTCDRPRHENHTVVHFDADIVTGDEYARALGMDRIDFLKIDVEGAEYRVLKGFTEMVERGGIRCIQFEYGAFSIQTRVLLADYYGWLASRYWIGKLFPSGVEFRDYSWRDESFRFANFVCISRDCPEARTLAEGF
jgi:FkbM family methyltransferase